MHQEITVDGCLYDGISPVAKQVQATFWGSGAIFLSDTESFEAHFVSADYKLEPPSSRSLVRVRFHTGELLEISYSHELHALLNSAASPLKRNLWRAERRISIVLGVSLVATAICVLLYIYALPVAAHALRPHVPQIFKEHIRNSAMTVLDRALFSSSSTPEAVQRRTEAQVAALTALSPIDQKIETLTRSMIVRKQPIMNAMALLPNTIIVTDELLKVLTAEEVNAVLAHELGHLMYDHGTEKLVRGSVASILSLLIFGADPGIFHTLGVGLVESQYSQVHENEADLFAMRLLCAQGSDPTSLATALKKISDDEDGAQEERWRYFSSHPTTALRVEKLSRGCN